MFGMRREARDRGRQQVHAGQRREVVEQDRHRRRVGDRRVVADERVGRHLALEKPRRAHEHGVGAVLRPPAAGALNRRLRRFAAGADDEPPVAQAPLRARRDRLDRDSKSSISTASPFEPRTTKPVSGRDSQRASAARRRAVSTRSRASNGVGSGAKTPARFIGIDCKRPRPSCCSARFSPRRRGTSATAGLSSHGKSANTRMFSTRRAASCPSSQPDRETRGRRRRASPRRR